MQAFRDALHRVRGRPTESGFDEDFAKLLAAYPQSEEYLKVLYDDRERWAEAFSSLTFGVSSWTTDRVEGNRVLHVYRLRWTACTAVPGIRQYGPSTGQTCVPFTGQCVHLPEDVYILLNDVCTLTR